MSIFIVRLLEITRETERVLTLLYIYVVLRIIIFETKMHHKFEHALFNESLSAVVDCSFKKGTLNVSN